MITTLLYLYLYYYKYLHTLFLLSHYTYSYEYSHTLLRIEYLQKYIFLYLCADIVITSNSKAKKRKKSGSSGWRCWILKRLTDIQNLPTYLNYQHI